MVEAENKAAIQERSSMVRGILGRERGRERGREEEKHQCVDASCVPPTGELTHSPGMCPDW